MSPHAAALGGRGSRRAACGVAVTITNERLGGSLALPVLAHAGQGVQPAKERIPLDDLREGPSFGEQVETDERPEHRKSRNRRRNCQDQREAEKTSEQVRTGVPEHYPTLRIREVYDQGRYHREEEPRQDGPGSKNQYPRKDQEQRPSPSGAQIEKVERVGHEGDNGSRKQGIDQTPLYGQ